LILLDTDVLSELLRAEPHSAVRAWMDATEAEVVWTTAIAVFEIRVGLEALAAGRRRSALEAEFSKVLAEDLRGRVLSFDAEAAKAAAAISARHRRAGRPTDIRDVLIAGIAAANGATLATPNTRHFEGIGLSLLDPWLA
jgi:predicted nucleic acid-binding protein